MADCKIQICGDRSVIVAFSDEGGTLADEKARRFVKKLAEKEFDWLIDSKILEDSAVLIYNPTFITYGKLCKQIAKLTKKGDVFLPKLSEAEQKQLVHSIPVCFLGKYAPDLKKLCESCGASESELINRLCKRDYLVRCILGGGKLCLSDAPVEISLECEKKEACAGSLIYENGRLFIAPTDIMTSGAIIGLSAFDYFSDSGEIICRPGEYIELGSVTENKFKKLCEKKENITQRRKVNIERQ